MAHADRLAETARLDQEIRPLSCQTYRACPALLEARTRKNNHPFPVPWALASRNSQTVRSAWRGGQPEFFWVAELLDSKGDPVVTGRGLGAISAEKAVPNR